MFKFNNCKVTVEGAKCFLCFNFCNFFSFFCLFCHQFCSFISSSLKIWLKLRRRLSHKCKCDRSEDGEDEESTDIAKEATGDENNQKNENSLAVEGNEENQLTRTSCHDSGIDIRDALPTVPVVPTKKVQNIAFESSFLLKIWAFLGLQWCWHPFKLRLDTSNYNCTCNHHHRFSTNTKRWT